MQLRLAEVTGARTAIQLTVDSVPQVLRLDLDGNILMSGGKLADEKSNPFVKQVYRAPNDPKSRLTPF